ncbi:hypothetical protein V5O48_010194 [Marasmius crinis-equi]|uniref:Cytochrome P450 n=1 Tax=Marasmius crinis-equi TaxID=585013 RepID=A0ABR3F8Z4_9AGAR
MEWAHQYGPIFHLKAGPDHIIVLNTPEATEDLFVKRNRIFSDRARLHVAVDIVSAGQRMGFNPGASIEYKAARKALSTALGPVPSKQHRQVQDLESRVLLQDLVNHGNQTADLTGENARDKNALHDPEFLGRHWFSLIRRFSTSVVLMVTYGERLHTIEGDKDLHELYAKLPDCLAPWRLKAQKMHERFSTLSFSKIKYNQILTSSPLNREMAIYGGYLTKIRSDTETRPDCFVATYLKDRDASTTGTSGRGVTPDGWLRDTLLAYSAGTVIEAGSDTTSSMLTSLVLFLVSHPHVVQKARDQLDKVVGSDRLPTYDDEPNLPYIVAIIKEVIRCRPATPIGIPHRCTETTTYNGYIIPEGAIVFGNVLTLHLDESHYENPLSFNPDRWLSSSDSSSPVRWGSSGPNKDRDHYVFGWGRRFCMGTYIAEASLFIVVARIIWGLEILGPASKLDPWDEENYTPGFVTNAVPFNVSFKPRSDRRAEVIKQAYEDAQEQWEVLGLRRDERTVNV